MKALAVHLLPPCLDPPPGENPFFSGTVERSYKVGFPAMNNEAVTSSWENHIIFGAIMKMILG
jgi:hypothetical protein